MGAFGKCKGGGRRSAARAVAPLAVVMTTVSRSVGAALIDVSCTGARVRGNNLPARGEDLEFKIQSHSSFGTVVWEGGDQRGIAFDDPLTPFQVECLRQSSQAGNLTHLSVEEKLALEEWLIGSPT